MTGHVKLITPAGYGFITTEDGRDYFFHMTEYKGDWDYIRKISPPRTTHGPMVEFQVSENSSKGLRAEKVYLFNT